MEVVEEFKQEVCQKVSVLKYFLLIFQIHSLYESRLPVSRAKMATITKLAMKGAKVNGRMNYSHKNG